MKLVRSNWQLLVILVLAIALRFWQLGSIPIGFNDDEAAFGYNAYSILKTGKDEWSRTLPLPAFESFGDWKLTVYLYLTVVSQFIFGPTTFATRLPSAIIGLFAVLSTFFLARKVFQDSKNAHIAALAAAFLMAISPWHVFASRIAFESEIIFYVSLSTFLFLKGLNNKKYLLFATVAFALSFYVYRSVWIFNPPFILTLIFIFRKKLAGLRIYLFKLGALLVFLLLPLAPTVLNFSGQSRFLQESFIYGVSRVGIINEINEKRGECQKFAPNIACQIIYNKYTSFITAFVNNYFENLSPGTYFTKGIANGYQSFANRGLFYSFELPLLIAGVIGMIVQKNPSGRILFAWILLAPIGASFTGIGNPGRLNIIMPAPQIIEAFGLFYIIGQIKRVNYAKIIYGLFAIVVLFSLAKLTADMFFHYPQISGKYQRYGYKQLFEYLELQKNNYDQIIVSRAADDAKQYIHYLFFTKQDPEIFFDSQITNRYRGKDGWQVVERIGKFHFYRQTSKIVDLPPKTLLAVGANEVSFHQDPKFMVKYLNGDVAFEVYDVDQIRKNLEQNGIRDHQTL